MIKLEHSTSLLLAITLALGACGERANYSSTTPARPPPSKTEVNTEMSKDAVRKVLRDPSSAEFSDIVCGDIQCMGKVNSKNGFGGYSGKKTFFVDIASQKVTVHQ